MKEDYPIVKIIHGRRKNLCNLKPLAVEVEISFQGKRKWISTGVRVLPKNWKPGRGVVGIPEAFDYNLKISHYESLINDHIRQLVIYKKPFIWSGLDAVLEYLDTGTSFISFVKDRVENRKDIKDSTRRNHRKFYKALDEFGTIKSFEDLTKINIEKYDQWLRSRKEYRQSTIASYHKYMKLYVNEALRLDLAKRNPYEGYKVVQGKSRTRKFLTLEELDKIESCSLPTHSLNKVRDVFVFQCYTGLSYADMKKFDFRLVEVRNGKHVLRDIRQKTGEDYYIVLMSKALAVLEKYDFVLPLMTNEQYNMRLKLVAEYARIQKNLTSHMGRHTYATICINSGIKLEVLAQMLGHADIRTTQIYARLMNPTIEDAYDVLERQENVKTMIEYFNRILELVLMCV